MSALSIVNWCGIAMRDEGWIVFVVRSEIVSPALVQLMIAWMPCSSISTSVTFHKRPPDIDEEISSASREQSKPKQLCLKQDEWACWQLDEQRNRFRRDINKTFVQMVAIQPSRESSISHTLSSFLALSQVSQDKHEQQHPFPTMMPRGQTAFCTH